jgi:hypothetical protein
VDEAIEVGSALRGSSKKSGIPASSIFSSRFANLELLPFQRRKRAW